MLAHLPGGRGLAVAEWRIARGWSAEELRKRIERLDGTALNFDAAQSEMTVEAGWNRYRSTAAIAWEPPGPPLPDGPFNRAEKAIANYQFSDPAIVVGHFDPADRLLGRRMLLEMKALLVLRYLGGVVVGATRYEEQDGLYTFGFRYDTLRGHIERGSEWFLLTKDVASGEIRFRIEATWLPGDFPNWWSRLGFRILGSRYQKRWHREAHRRLYHVARGLVPAAPQRDSEGIAHAGEEVSFERELATRASEGLHLQEDETLPSP